MKRGVHVLQSVALHRHLWLLHRPVSLLRDFAVSEFQRKLATPTVDAQLAYDCLTSVPLNESAAITLVESILPFLEWQSGTHSLVFPTTWGPN
jgi:hypothetical protein